MKAYSFLLKELHTCGAVLSTFELVQSLKQLGIDARIVSDYNNKELEDYFDIKVERESKGIIIVVSPKCEGEWAYVRTADPRWKTHESKKIVVSKYLQDWLKDGIIIGNGTHSRFYDMGLDRDIDCLVIGNDEPNKNIQNTIEKARSFGETIYWLGRQTRTFDGVQSLEAVSISDVPRFYNRAKTFLSMSKSEGWGRPVAEAMACGVPTIINENGGNREIEVVSWESIAKSFIEKVC